MPATTSAPASAPATAPAVPDHVKGLLDAYDAARERTKFLAAAGVDNELEANEFQADKAKGDGFVQRFERWRNLLAYDKNASKTLDWSEAEAYRQNLRTRLLPAFDEDKDGKLTGEERDSASRALARGWSGEEPAGLAAAGPGRPWAGGGAPGAGGGPAGGGLAGGGPLGGGAARRRGPQWDRQELIARFDKDGDGQLSEEERQAAIKDFEEQQRQETLQKYDQDGDGKLSAEESAAMREDMRQQAQPWKQLTDRLAARLFDADEEDQLTEQGKADAKEFQKKLQELGKEYDRRFNDLDGDGNVTQEERRQVQAEWRGQTLRMMALGLKYMDADGDGKVTAEEREGFTERMRGGVEKWATKFIDKFDLDGDGKLSAEERADLLKGFKADIDRRIGKAAPDAAGRLTPRQAIGLIEDFAQDLGLAPKARTPATAPEDEE
jgi:Ca2+-binding EF-hand superfamily protein